MPVYLDRHHIEGVTADAVAAPVVRQLCLGRIFTFESFGRHQLDGFHEEVELVAVAWK